MKTLSRVAFTVFISATIVAINSGDLFAQEDKGGIPVSISGARIADVEGDVEKFRAHNWMTDGYAGGVNSLSFEEALGDDGSVHFDLHAIPDENDVNANMLFTKNDLGAFDIQYQTFKKYYDNSGGFFYHFNPTYNSTEGEEDLDLDVGHFMFGIDPAFGVDYGLNFSYEHRFKEGKKSRLSWAEVDQNGFQRETAPSWQDIDETTDIISVSASTDIGGFNVSGEHNYEITKADTERVEKYLAEIGASGNKIRHQFQEPESIALTTVLKGEKWYNDDRSFLSLAYRFNQINNKESENIVETTAAGTPTNAFGSPKNYADSSAENKLNSHSWVAHYVNSPSKNLNLSVKSKVTSISKDSTSAYNRDHGGAAPDGVIDDEDIHDTKSTLYKFGESLGFRYTGIARTALYGDVEFGYNRNKLSEEEWDDSGAKTWFRNTDTDTQVFVWTLGSRYVPSKKFNVTTQFRRNQELNDYDDQEETASINSAFFEELSIVTNEATTKFTWKPVEWMTNALRYQYQHRKHTARHESLLDQEAITDSQTVTLDAFLQVMDNLFMNISVSQQLISTVTAASSETSSARAPEFDGDVTSLLWSTSYAPNEDISFINTAVYSFSDNFEDFTSTALPLAVSNSRFNTEIGMRWAPKNKDWSIEPKYAFYDYNTHSESEYGDYRAHIVWLDFAYTW